MQLGYFHVIAEPVSTCVHDSRAFSRQMPRLVTKFVDAAPALPVAGIPVLDGGILHLGIPFDHDLDHGGVQLVFVALRRGAPFEVAHVGALVGHDQRAFELPRAGGVDAEIGRQLHRAAHPLGM